MIRETVKLNDKERDVPQIWWVLTLSLQERRNSAAERTLQRAAKIALRTHRRKKRMAARLRERKWRQHDT
jgi:hypothetical protein